MASKRRTSLSDAKAFYALQMAAVSGSADPRLERIFELVPREAFLPPGPWQVMAGTRYIETPSPNAIHLYQNVLVALDASRRINNGEPFLHARWLGAVAPKSGDTICHIGAGTGYYTAILSMLALPSGRIEAFEIDAHLAAQARRNLEPFEAVVLTHGDATRLPLPSSDLIYVNAGVNAPPVSWLRALRPGGRMILPWRPAEKVGLALLVSREGDGSGFAVKPLMPSWFIPCIGASDRGGCAKIPSAEEASSSRSVWLTTHRAPDATATAIYDRVWFSTLSASGGGA